MDLNEVFDLLYNPVSGEPGHTASHRVIHGVLKEIVNKLKDYVELPSGGTDGQMLVKNGNGLAWEDVKPASPMGYLASHSIAYRTAAENAKTSRLKILTIGDSTNDGYGTPGGPDQWEKTWPLKLAQNLRENLSLPPGGRGWIGATTPLDPGNYVWNPSTLSPAGLALDTLNNQIGVPGSLWLQRGDGSKVDEVTWVLKEGVTAVDIITTGYGGNMEITCANASSSLIKSSMGDRIVTRIDNPGGTVRIHPEPSQGFAIVGIIEYIGDTNSGVTMCNLSQASMAAHEYAAWLLNSSMSLKPLIESYAPHVALVCLGSNDYPERTIAELTSSIISINTSIKSASPNTDVVFIIRSIPNESEAMWNDYANAIITTANTIGAYTIDTRELLPLNASGKYIFDGVHYTESGNTSMAQIVSDYMKI